MPPGWWAFVHPPTYYFLTAGAALALLQLTPLENLLTAGRLVGVLWLSGAMLLVWQSCRYLGVPVAGRWGAVLLLASSPATLHGHAIVTVDATVVLAGAAVVAAVLRWDAQRQGLVVLAAVSGAPFMAARARMRSFGAALGVSMIIGAPIFFVINYAATSMVFLTPFRYGLPLAAGLVVAAAAITLHRWYARSLLFLGVASTAATLWVLANPVLVAP